MSFTVNGGVMIGFLTTSMGVVFLVYTRRLLRIHNFLLTLSHKNPPQSPEPANWSVNLTRALSFVLIIIGVLMAIDAQSV